MAEAKAETKLKFFPEAVPQAELENALEQFVKWGAVLGRAQNALFKGVSFYEFHSGWAPGETPKFVNIPEPAVQEAMNATFEQLWEAAESAAALLKIVKG